MEILKKSSIRIENKIVAHWPQYATDEAIDMSGVIENFDHRFSRNNGVICFVSENAAYVTPYTRKAEATLKRAGFAEDYFYVPFSNWDFPKFEEKKWEHLKKEAEAARNRDYENDCIDWCNEHGVGRLNDTVLWNCFKMPRTGVPVKHLYFEDTYYPLNTETILDWSAISRLGRFAANNGIIVFVNRDGHTYVAKGYGIIDDLLSAGFRPSSLFVPFSNGEQIRDHDLAARWAAVPKR